MAETITRGGMEKGDTGANGPETPTKAGNDIDTSFSLISPSGKHWFSTHAELRAPPPPFPPVSCSIDTNVERIEPNRGRNVATLSRDKFARRFASHYDHLGLRIEWGRRGGGREDYFSFCRIGPTKCVSRYRKRKKERERRENHRSWCNFGVWYMVHLKSMNFLSFMMDRDSLMGSLSRYFPILCWKFNLRRLGQRIIAVWNFFRYSRLDFG